MSLAKPTTQAGEYFENWGVTPILRKKIINAALSRGGEDCDLFFQHSASTAVRLSDGKVNQASTNVDLGMGVPIQLPVITRLALPELGMNMAQLCRESVK